MTDGGVTGTPGWTPANSSEALVVASYLKVAATGLDVTLGDLAVAYREDYLNVHEGTTGDLSRQGSMLAVEEVRRHLVASALPRLATENILQPPVPTDPNETDAVLSFTLPPDGRTDFELRERLLAVARELIHLAEPTTDEPVVPEGSVLTGRGLTKSYRRRTVVADVDISLKQGEIVGLLGPNGAGKTTTFYMIVGLVRPDAGDIMIDGNNIHRLPMYRRARLGIGYLAQEPSIFRKLTVEQNVMAVLETLKLSSRERRERLESLLDELTIKHLRKVPAYQLSGGERRRLEITRALVTEPRFMLLDEPFAGVDPIAVHDIQTIVASLRKRGIGVLITDHNVEQTLDIVDRAYIMFEGQVQVAGTVKELVMNDRVADLYLGPTLTARLRERLGVAA